MKWLCPLVLATTFAGPVHCEVLDLGDLKKYDPKIVRPSSPYPDRAKGKHPLINWTIQDALPTGLEANSIWVKPVDGGFDIVLGQDTKAKVDGVLEGCGDSIDQCYQEVAKVLHDAFVKIDNGIERRQAGPDIEGMNEVAQGWGSLANVKDGASYLIAADWAANKKYGDEKGSFWPDEAAIGIANFANATSLTVSAGGSAVMTITQAPDPTTSLKG